GAARVRVACDQDFAVALQRDSTAKIGAEVGGSLAIAIEGSVQTAIGVIAHQRKIEVESAVVVKGARDQDLAVTLYGHAVAIIAVKADDAGGNLAIAIEASVEAAVAAVAREPESAIGVACHKNLSVALHCHASTDTRRGDSSRNLALQRFRERVS